MYLYFENSRGKYQFICEATPETVGPKITEDVHRRNPNYKIYYTRCMGNEKEGFTYDVGSWSEFYHLAPAPLTLD